MSSGAPDSPADARPGYDPALTRRLLLDSAVELFGEKGFHASSVQEIVEAAGLTKGAFYHHFTNKEDVLILIQDELVAVQAKIVAEILESRASAVAQLRALVRMMVLNASRYQSQVAVFYRERRFLARERAADVDRRWDVVQQQMEQIVQRGVESGELDPRVDSRIAVAGIVGMAVWVNQWFRPDGALSIETIADELAQMALSGLVRGADPQ